MTKVFPLVHHLKLRYLKSEISTDKKIDDKLMYIKNYLICKLELMFGSNKNF